MNICEQTTTRVQAASLSCCLLHPGHFTSPGRRLRRRRQAATLRPQITSTSRRPTFTLTRRGSHREARPPGPRQPRAGINGISAHSPFPGSNGHGWCVSPSRPKGWSRNHPVPQTVTLFGGRVFTEVIRVGPSATGRHPCQGRVYEHRHVYREDGA